MVLPTEAEYRVSSYMNIVLPTEAEYNASRHMQAREVHAGRGAALRKENSREVPGRGKGSELERTTHFLSLSSSNFFFFRSDTLRVWLISSSVKMASTYTAM